MIVAAAKFASLGYTQKEIARNLKTNVVDVNRLIQYARAFGWLTEPMPRLVNSEIESKVLRDVEETYFAHDELQKRLEELSKGMLVALYVTRTAHEHQFFTEASRRLIEIFARAKCLGITWGRTIEGLVSELELARAQSSKGRKYVQFFPVCGEPFQGEAPQTYSSSALASRLHRVWNSDSKSLPPSIAGMPAFIPQSVDETAYRAFKEILEKASGYGAVFGVSEPKKAGLIDQADTFLTSVGVPQKKYQGIFLTDRLLLKDLKPGHTEWIVGDLGGIIIEKEETPYEIRAHLKQLNSRWNGVTADHLRNCVKRRTKRVPGVIIVAKELNRLNMVQRCVADGLVSTLVLSGALADALERHLKIRKVVKS